ncbi:MAG: response regulator transcription factor [Arcobacteraceae bacterium]|nr:response regulator transcription factor [Arcobacteraceae bacterium]
MVNILMIEDDKELAEILTEYLAGYNIKVTNYENPEVGLMALAVKKFDLIILDLSLPNIDGVETCRILRNKTDLPIIISSARSDITDKAACFSVGADDFLPKPYDSRELVLRINSLLRRCKMSVHKDKATCGNKIFELNKSKMEIKQQGQILKLTNAEFDILSYLIKKSNFVVSREEILLNVESINYESSYKSVDVLIGRLRNKIEINSKVPQYLITIRGVGYKLINE